MLVENTLKMLVGEHFENAGREHNILHAVWVIHIGNSKQEERDSTLTVYQIENSDKNADIPVL